jgi:hypothetical protein
MEVSGQLHAPAALLPGKGVQYPLCKKKKLGELPNRSGRCGKEKNLLPLLEIEPRPSSP